MWKGIDGRALNLAQIQAHIDGLPATTWASGMTLHNTAAPSLAQRPQGFTQQHIRNLEGYYRDTQGWSSGPHAFIDDTATPYHLFTKFTDKGTHSPSWNGTKIGIEMLGDYAVEAVNSGRGLKVINNAVALFALLHTKYGWNPETIKLHKEDPATTHDCPGRNVVKADFISRVEQYMGHAGGHPAEPTTPTLPPSPRIGTANIPADDTLNVRASASASSSVVYVLSPNEAVSILSEARNGPTLWFRVSISPTGGSVKGWVAARYIKEKA